MFRVSPVKATACIAAVLLQGCGTIGSPHGGNCGSSCSVWIETTTPTGGTVISSVKPGMFSEKNSFQPDVEKIAAENCKLRGFGTPTISAPRKLPDTMVYRQVQEFNCSRVETPMAVIPSARPSAIVTDRKFESVATNPDPYKTEDHVVALGGYCNKTSDCKEGACVKSVCAALNRKQGSAAKKIIDKSRQTAIGSESTKKLADSKEVANRGSETSIDANSKSESLATVANASASDPKDYSVQLGGYCKSTLHCAEGSCVTNKCTLYSRTQARSAEAKVSLSNQSASEKSDKLAQDMKQRSTGNKSTAKNDEGDGTPDHISCTQYGFRIGTTSYSECRQKLDMARREYAQRQAIYEGDLHRYKEQLAAIEEQRQTQQSLRLMQFGLGMMAGKSPYASENFANAAREAAGVTPIAPTPPQMQTFIINDARSGMRTCTLTNNVLNCH